MRDPPQPWSLYELCIITVLGLKYYYIKVILLTTTHTCSAIESISLYRKTFQSKITS